jgi:pSer/pThr/pTyr-binding forkhead associated (FHA) protein
MVLRFSVCAGRRPRHEQVVDDGPWRVIDVAVAEGEVRIGRKPGSGIELPFPQVSATHLRVIGDKTGFRVEDLGSANGTWLGDRRLSTRKPRPIAPGDILDVAGIRVRFDGELPTHAAAAGEDTETFARRLLNDVFSACPPGEPIQLVGIDGPGAGRTLAFSPIERSMTVGRGETCDVVLRDEDVSREHAAFERDSAGVSVRDLGSKNGVIVQGQVLDAVRRLRDGDHVRIGQTMFRFDDPEDRYLRQVRQAIDQPPAAAPEASVASEAASAKPPARQWLPAVATAVGILVLLWLVVLVLALAFG